MGCLYCLDLLEKSYPESDCLPFAITNVIFPLLHTQPSFPQSVICLWVQIKPLNVYNPNFTDSCPHVHNARPQFPAKLSPSTSGRFGEMPHRGSQPPSQGHAAAGCVLHLESFRRCFSMNERLVASVWMLISVTRTRGSLCSRSLNPSGSREWCCVPRHVDQGGAILCLA